MKVDDRNDDESERKIRMEYSKPPGETDRERDTPPSRGGMWKGGKNRHAEGLTTQAAVSSWRVRDLHVRTWAFRLIVSTFAVGPHNCTYPTCMSAWRYSPRSPERSA